ncbi:cell surface glycoprotein CD200 receptor 1-A-like isoform X2 [Mixophyes fleayi]|uniref:cell surface glycoprotein CD200 receptor 1-A-like isoform X2 n=1 Tax=Mixophyes fleayi TaxID=3061075 RepID=UPI003F4DA12C
MKTKTSSMQLWQKHFIDILLILISMTIIKADVSSVCAGNNTVLECDHEPGDSLVMVVWKVHRLDRSHCLVSFDASGNQTFNNCSDRMYLDVGVNRASLRIHNSTISDEGNYTCEIVNANGTHISRFMLQVLVAPYVLVKINRFGYPECQAIGGHPAADILWTPKPYYEEQNKHYTEKNRTTTVISTYNPTDVNVTEATCVVSHPTFTSPVRRLIKVPAVGQNNIWWASAPILLLVIAIGVIVFWQQTHFRYCLRKEKDNTPDMQENPTVTVEDVEPYASFTQKVNSIYNSTNELSESNEKNWSPTRTPSPNRTPKNYR